MPRPRATLVLTAVALGITGLALWARLTVLPEVFVGDHVLTRDPDAHYHLHRIARAVADFPLVPAFEPRLDWPAGAAVPWAPGFDFLAAAMVRLAAGDADPGRADRVAALYPVLLGLIVVATTAALARRLTRGVPQSAAIAIVAALWVAVLPRPVLSSQLGRVDHHVFEALSMLLLGLWALWAIDRRGRPVSSRRAWIGFEAVGALIVFAAGSGFTGSILYVTLAGSALIAFRLIERVPDPARRGAWGLLGSGAPAFAGAALGLFWLARPYVALHGEPLAYHRPSHLQPLLHGIAAIGCAVAVAVARVGRDEPDARHRLLRRAALLAGLAFGAGLVALPALAGALREGALGWLGRRDPWLGSIDEFQPLFSSWALWRPEVARAAYHFNGLPGLLAPIALPFGLVWVARARPAPGLAFAGWTLALGGLTLLQNRFGQVLSPWYAVCLAVTSVAAASWLAERLGALVPPRGDDPSSGPTVSRPVVLALLVAGLALADPAIRQTLRWRAPRPLTAIESAALFLRGQPRDDTAPGVLASWAYGHSLLRLAERPVLTAGFGHWTGEAGFLAAEQFMYRREDELLALMERRRLSWVVTGMRAPFPTPSDAPGEAGKPFVYVAARDRIEPSPGYFARFPLTPLIVGGTGIAERGIPHVARLMPRFASPNAARGLGFPLHRLWVYERVPGARITGRAEPGSRVEARTSLVVHGAPTAWVAWGEADAEGRFELVVPLPNGLGRGEPTAPLASGDGYDLRAGGRGIGRVVVPEAAVRSGARVELPEASVASAGTPPR